VDLVVVDVVGSAEDMAARQEVDTVAVEVATASSHSRRAEEGESKTQNLDYTWDTTDFQADTVADTVLVAVATIHTKRTCLRLTSIYG
jgi:hypothetical protein